MQVTIGVLAAQALALLGFSGWLIAQRVTDTPSNEMVFEGSAVYLVVSGVMMGLVALALRSLRGWAYAATIVVQLIALGVTYEMARAGFWIGAMPLGVAAITAVAALFTRSARTAFGRDTT